MVSRDNLELRRARRVAREAAVQLLAYYSVEEASHIMLEAFAEAQGAPVFEGPLDGAVARLIRVADRGRIRVADSEGNEGRKRFSIAHELGHFLLGHTDLRWTGCNDRDMAEFGGRAMAETEANYFAAELLLPDELVRPRCDVRKVDLRSVKAIAEDFGTSITSTAIRFIEFCPEMCAVVFSQGNRIRWSRQSDSFWPWLRRWGGELDRECGAAQFFRGGDVSSRPQKMDGGCWLEEKGAERYGEVVEHSMVIPSIEAVLTMLWIDQAD